MPEIACVMFDQNAAIMHLRDHLPKRAQSKARCSTPARPAPARCESRRRCPLGPRASGPFVPLNCVALREVLVGSQLLGHASGALIGSSAGHRRRARMDLWEIPARHDGGALDRPIRRAIRV